MRLNLDLCYITFCRDTNERNGDDYFFFVTVMNLRIEGVTHFKTYKLHTNVLIPILLGVFHKGL